MRLASTARLARSLLIVAAGALSLLAGACEDEKKNVYVAPPPPEVSVAQPRRQSVTEYLEFTGNTEARETAELRARVKGFLKSVHFADGAYVKEGDLLFVIDPAEYQAAVAAGKAKVAEVSAKLERATRDLSRAQTLFKQGNISEQVLDLRLSDKLQAQAEVQVAEADLEQAQLKLGYTRVTAPFDGRMGRTLVDAGNLVGGDGNTHLATIVSTDPIYAYFSLNEKDLLRVRKPQANNGAAPERGDKVRAIPLQLGLTNEEGFPHQGNLDFADTGVDPTTGTILLRGVFANASRALLPGLFVRIRAPIGESADALLVDDRAVGIDQRGRYVLVVNDQNKVETRPVEIGAKADGLRQIRTGLAPGDWVVVSGLQRAREGIEVKPNRLEPSAGAPAAVTPPKP